MWKWAPYPFLRITPVLIAGILTGYHTNFTFPLWLYLVFLGFYLMLVIGTPRRYLVYISIPTGIIGLLLIFLLGTQLVIERKENQNRLHIANTNETFHYYAATVTEPPQHKSHVYRTVVAVHYLIQTDSLHNRHTIFPALGKVILYQPLKDSLHLWHYGDQVLIKGKPKPIQPQANPDEFDYRQHLAVKNIYHQHYLSSQEWAVYGHQPEWSLLAFSNELRENSKNILLSNISTQAAAGVALALTLGIKDYLDDTISESYAATGAMHVLAVSGLHVGIIYLVLSFLLHPLLQIPHMGRWMSAGICILALWLYALLAGCSPSVLRAATMFSFIMIAQTTRWQTNTFNTLAVSAFFLLCYDPLLIFSVGFQLSYLAVAGIMYLQPKIYRWLDFNLWLSDKIWSLTSVSIAAQLATFPISLYYFHQFPVYFWLSNLLVIPAAFVILALGLLTLLIGYIAPQVAPLPGVLLDRIITIVNHCIAAIERMPMSTWQEISIDLSQMLLIYGLIICILLLIHYRQFRYTLYAFGCILSLSILRFYQFYNQNLQNTITFYSVDQQSNIDFTTGISNFHVGEYNPKAQYHISPHHIQAGLLTSFIPKPEEEAGGMAMRKISNLMFCIWRGQKIIFVQEPFEQKVVLREKIKADILVLCNNAVKKLEPLCSNFDFSLLVIDSSNHAYLAQKLADEASSLKIVYHAVPQQGALTIHIPD